MTHVIFEEDVLMLICGYAQQSGGSFNDELKGECDIHSAGDLVIYMGDFNDMLVGIIMDLW